MDRAAKIAQQKRESYNRNKEAINAKRRMDYKGKKQVNNEAVGDVFITEGIHSMAIKNPAILSDKIQWQEGMKVPSYLSAVENKSKTNQQLASIYNNSYQVDQQLEGTHFNKKCLRQPPATDIRKPTPRPVIDNNNIPAWKKGGKESSFASNPEFISPYASGFF